jgi:hypothetical protein
MGQDINSLLTGLASSLNQYMGMNIQNNMEQANQQRANAAKLGQMDYQQKLDLEKQAAGAELDLKGKTATEVFKLGLEGKVDFESASKLYPEEASFVTTFEKENGRLPTIKEFNDTLNSKLKGQENQIRRDEMDDARMNRFIAAHAKNIGDKGLPALLTTYEELRKAATSNKDIAGIGTLDSQMWNVLISKEGKQNRENFRQLAAGLLKVDTGLAATDMEYKRFLERMQAGKMPDEEAFRVQIGKVGKDLKQIVGTAESGLPPKAKQMYYEREDALRSSDIQQYDAFGKDAPKGPAVGTIMDGHKFLGGNPADPKSWGKI